MRQSSLIYHVCFLIVSIHAIKSNAAVDSEKKKAETLTRKLLLPAAAFLVKNLKFTQFK
jgi:hypothetical protein